MPGVNLRSGLMAALCLLSSSAGAIEPGDMEFAEGALSRLALERSAIIACASDNAELQSDLTNSWAAELKAGGELLAKHGFPADYVNNLPARYDLDAVKPAFSSKEQRDRFCAVLGDWQKRWNLFFIPSPVMELTKALQK